MRLRWWLFALGLGCTSATSLVVSRPDPSAPRTQPHATTDAAVAAVDAAVASPPAPIGCPVQGEHLDTPLARIGDVTLTGCDVVVAWHRGHHIGRLDDDPRSVFTTLLQESLFAAEEQRLHPGRDPEIDRVLAEALFRHEALAGLSHASTPPEAPPTPTVARVRLRALVFRTRPDALRAITALEGGEAWEAVLPRSIDPLASRDQGDLGIVSRDTTDGIDPAVVRAGFALASVGDVSPPLAITTSVTVLVRRRPRVRRVTGYWVVQLVETLDATTRAPTGPRRARDVYLGLRAEARNRWTETLAPTLRAAIDDEALRTVRVAPHAHGPVDPPRTP